MPPVPQKDAIIGKILLNGGSAEFPTGELSPPSSTETAISTMVLPRTHAPHRRNKKGRTHRQPKKKKKKQKFKAKIYDRCRDKDETKSSGVLCPQIPARRARECFFEVEKPIKKQENPIKIAITCLCRKNIFSGPETMTKSMWFLFRKFFEKFFFSKKRGKFVELVENGHKRGHGFFRNVARHG